MIFFNHCLLNKCIPQSSTVCVANQHKRIIMYIWGESFTDQQQLSYVTFWIFFFFFLNKMY